MVRGQLSLLLHWFPVSSYDLFSSILAKNKNDTDKQKRRLMKLLIKANWDPYFPVKRRRKGSLIPMRSHRLKAATLMFVPINKPICMNATSSLHRGLDLVCG